MSKQQINQRPSSMVSETSTAVTTSAVDTKPGSKVKGTGYCFSELPLLSIQLSSNADFNRDMGLA